MFLLHQMRDFITYVQLTESVLGQSEVKLCAVSTVSKILDAKAVTQHRIVSAIYDSSRTGIENGPWNFRGDRVLRLSLRSLSDFINNWWRVANSPWCNVIFHVALIKYQPKIINDKWKQQYDTLMCGRYTAKYFDIFLQGESMSRFVCFNSLYYTRSWAPLFNWTPYGRIEHGQHWSKRLLIPWWHQATASFSVDQW